MLENMSPKKIGHFFNLVRFKGHPDISISAIKAMDSRTKINFGASIFWLVPPRVRESTNRTDKRHDIKASLLMSRTLMIRLTFRC